MVTSEDVGENARKSDYSSQSLTALFDVCDWKRPVRTVDWGRVGSEYNTVGDDWNRFRVNSVN